MRVETWERAFVGEYGTFAGVRETVPHVDVVFVASGQGDGIGAARSGVDTRYNGPGKQEHVSVLIRAWGMLTSTGLRRTALRRREYRIQNERVSSTAPPGVWCPTKCEMHCTKGNGFASDEMRLFFQDLLESAQN